MEENSEDEDKEQWAVPLERNPVEQTPHKSPDVSLTRNSNTEPIPVVNQSIELPLETEHAHRRTIIQIDIDCFYAQVEMIRNPSLRDKPLGIQQKYIVVTCNYKAREFGVTKLMTLKDAKEKCPQLILVSGEDLTNYRTMSYKITEVLQKFLPVVERLGFDENFMDVTHLVESRLLRGAEQKSVKVAGFIYGTSADGPTDVSRNGASSCGCGCHLRLAIGSQIAWEIRQTLYKELGITCCAGIAHNKLIAKLVGSVNKPNKQTTLFPEDTLTFMTHLGSVGKIPGIGYSSVKKLAGLGIKTVSDLQACSIETLLTEFEEGQSMRMMQLSYGVDDTAVKLTGQPQSISDEDSFRKCSSEKEVKKKILELLDNLLIRVYEDGRTPQTVRLTIRKFTTVNKYTNRESRQCSIPTFIFSSFTPDCFSRLKIKLCEILMPLFYKLVDVNSSFHLTLINVCFAKFVDRSKNQIKSFFQACKGGKITSDLNYKTPERETLKNSSSKDVTPVKELHESLNEELEGSLEFVNSRKRLFSPISFEDIASAKKSRTETVSSSSSFKGNSDFPLDLENKSSRTELACVPDSAQVIKLTNNISEMKVPPGMDESVFRSLPLEIQQEIIEYREHRVDNNEKNNNHTKKNNTAGKKKMVSGKGNNKPQSQMKDFCHRMINKQLRETPFGKALNSPKVTMTVPMNDTLVEHVVPVNSDFHEGTVSYDIGNQRSPQVSTSLSPTGKCSVQSPSQTLPPNLTVPPNVDKDVFNSLPRELQEELFLDWRLKNVTGSSKKQKTSGILKYYQKKS